MNREVKEEELKAFVESYPRKLEIDVTQICEPPMLSYNDFTLGKWPESVVASIKLDNPRRFYLTELSESE